MWIRTIGTLILLAAGAQPELSSGQTEAPWLGTWELDPTRSTQRAENPYKRTVVTIEDLGPGIKVTYDMVGVRGGRTHVEWVGAFDGRDYALQGVDSVLTNAYSLTDANSYEIVVKADGLVAATTRVSVSSDRRTLTAVTSEAGPQGDVVTTTSVYGRQ